MVKVTNLSNTGEVIKIKRIVKLCISLLMAALLLASGFTLAMFTSSTELKNNTFEAGTVQLGSPATNLVNIENMAPGDQGTYSYSVTYEGSLDAWIGLDTTLAGDLASFLTVTTSDGTNTYSPNALDQVVGKVSGGTTISFNIQYSLPLSTPNAAQGKNAIYGIQVKATQAANNTKADNSGPIGWDDTSTLDQSSGVLTIDTNGADQIPWAQTFTAGRTGLMDRVELYLHGPADLDVTVTIRTVDESNQPTDTILATATIQNEDIPNGDNLISVSFDSPAPITAGTKYAIYRTAFVSSDWSWNTPVSNDSYPAGQAWADRRADLGYWESYSSYDLPFRTYVQ